MRPLHYFRPVLVLSLLGLAQLAVAQTPAPTATGQTEPAARPEELVRYFTRELALQPHQSIALRRGLLTARDEAAPSPLEVVRPLLTATQLQRLTVLQSTPELRRLMATR